MMNKPITEFPPEGKFVPVTDNGGTVFASFWRGKWRDVLSEAGWIDFSDDATWEDVADEPSPVSAAPAVELDPVPKVVEAIEPTEPEKPADEPATDPVP